MSLFRNIALVRRRRTGGSHVQGRWKPGEPSDEAFRGSWQPARGKTLELLPEGKRSREVYRCFAPISLDFRPADAHDDNEADTIIMRGVEYEVTTASRWDNGVMSHWDLLCTRPKEGEK